MWGSEAPNLWGKNSVLSIFKPRVNFYRVEIPSLWGEDSVPFVFRPRVNYYGAQQGKLRSLQDRCLVCGRKAHRTLARVCSHNCVQTPSPSSYEKREVCVADYCSPSHSIVVLPFERYLQTARFRLRGRRLVNSTRRSPGLSAHGHPFFLLGSTRMRSLLRVGAASS